MKICSLRNSFEVNITCLSYGGKNLISRQEMFCEICFHMFPEFFVFSLDWNFLSSIQKYMKRDLFDIFFELTGMLGKKHIGTFCVKLAQIKWGNIFNTIYWHRHCISRALEDKSTPNKNFANLFLENTMCSILLFFVWKDVNINNWEGCSSNQIIRALLLT